MKILPLLNKIAIITGGSEGLGFEIAKKFILAGASITICSRNKKNLKSAEFKLKKLLNKNQKLLTIVADISKENDVKKLIDQYNLKPYYNINNFSFDLNLYENYQLIRENNYIYIFTEKSYDHWSPLFVLTNYHLEDSNYLPFIIKQKKNCILN